MSGQVFKFLHYCERVIAKHLPKKSLLSFKPLIVTLLVISFIQPSIAQNFRSCRSIQKYQLISIPREPPINESLLDLNTIEQLSHSGVFEVSDKLGHQYVIRFESEMAEPHFEIAASKVVRAIHGSARMHEVFELSPAVSEKILNFLEKNPKKVITYQVPNISQRRKIGDSYYLKATITRMTDGIVGSERLTDFEIYDDLLPFEYFASRRKALEEEDKNWKYWNLLDHEERAHFERVLGSIFKFKKVEAWNQSDFKTFLKRLEKMTPEEGIHFFDFVFMNVPKATKTKLIEAWLTLRILQIRDLHSGNWIFDFEKNRVKIIDAAFLDLSRLDAVNSLWRPLLQHPLDGGIATPHLVNWMLTQISPEFKARITEKLLPSLEAALAEGPRIPLEADFMKRVKESLSFLRQTEP